MKLSRCRVEKRSVTVSAATPRSAAASTEQCGHLVVIVDGQLRHRLQGRKAPWPALAPCLASNARRSTADPADQCAIGDAPTAVRATQHLTRRRRRPSHGGNAEDDVVASRCLVTGLRLQCRTWRK